MMRIIFLLLLFSNIICAQNKNNSLDYYYRGNDALKTGQYKLADSLYTLSINSGPHPDTYVNRAIARQKLSDKKGYCNDLSHASNMGDKEANKMFWKDCGNRDTIFLLPDKSKGSRSSYSYKEVIEQCDYTGHYRYKKYDGNDSLMLHYTIEQNDTNFIGGSEFVRAQFPGGDNALINYSIKNYNIPRMAKDAGLSGKIYVSFVINTNGSVENIKIKKGMAGCKACDEEAINMVKSMPKWSIATVSGRPVKSTYTLPVNITVTR